MDAKTIGLGVGATVLGLGMTGIFSKTWTRKSIKEEIEKPRLAKQQWHFLDAGAEVALHADATLEDIVERLQKFSKFDEDVFQEFVREAASCAEFLIRKEEIRARSRPLLFRGFSTTMIHRIRELRRAVREQEPQLLEEFDEVAVDVTSFQNDQHHNLWCDANS